MTPLCSHSCSLIFSFLGTGQKEMFVVWVAAAMPFIQFSISDFHCCFFYVNKAVSFAITCTICWLFHASFWFFPLYHVKIIIYTKYPWNTFFGINLYHFYLPMLTFVQYMMGLVSFLIFTWFNHSPPRKRQTFAYTGFIWSKL